MSSHLSLNLGGRRGTTDDVATIPFDPSLSSAALRESPNPIPVHSLMLSSHLFFCLPLRLAPFTVPCKIVFAMPEDIEMWPYHLSFLFFTIVMHSSCILDSVANLLVRHMVFVGYIQKSPIASHLKGLDPSLDFCFKVQLSQALRKVDKMGVRISLTLEASEMFLTLHIIFSLERAAVVWAILERISGFDPSLKMIAPRYLKFSTSSSLWPFILISLWKPFGLFVITFVLSGLISILYLVVVVSRRSTKDASFFFLFCIYDNIICKAEVGNKSSSDADTTFMVTQCLTHDSL